MATVKQTKTITGSTSSSTWTWKQVITESWADDYLTTNKSIVKVETYMGRATNSSTASFGGTATTKITCDEETRSKKQNWIYQSFWISGGSWKLIQTEQFEVEHDADGTKTINVSSSLSTSEFNPNSASANGSITLTTIPRTTDCPNLDGYIESGAIISLNPASDTFKHRLYYSYNDKEGYYPSSSGFFVNTGTLPLDTSFYSYTSKSTGTGDITLYTYTSDGTLIGSSTGTITVRCDKEKCKPTITATIIDVNSNTTALTDSDAKLVKGHSTAQITYTITPRNGASISSKKVNNATLGTSPHKITNVSTGTFEIVAVDSRGFDTTETYNNTLINYVPLTLDFNAFRPTPTGSAIAVNFQGNYFNGSFGSVSNTLTLSWKYRLKGESSWQNGGSFVKDTDYTINGNKFTSKGNITLSDTMFPYQNNYEIAIYYTDKLINTSTSKPVPKGKPVLNWEDDLVNVNGVLTINDESVGDGSKVSSAEPIESEKIWIQCSKNLYNGKNYSFRNDYNSGINYANANDASIKSNGSWSRTKATITNLKPNTQYVLSANVDKTNLSVDTISGFYSDDHYQTSGFVYPGYITGKAIYKFTSDVNGKHIVDFYTNWSGDTVTGNVIYSNIQLEEGTVVTDYDPYVEKKIHTKNTNGTYEELLDVENSIKKQNYFVTGPNQTADITFKAGDIAIVTTTYKADNWKPMVLLVCALGNSLMVNILGESSDIYTYTTNGLTLSTKNNYDGSNYTSVIIINK